MATVHVSQIAPPLPGRVMTEQSWLDVAFLHWAVDPELVAPMFPPGTTPDVFDNATYVGLVPFRTSGAGLGRGLPVPWLGDYPETNVRLYSVDDAGRHGVVFQSLDVSRLLISLAGRWALQLPYAWSRIYAHGNGGERSWELRRRWPKRGLKSLVQVRVSEPIEPTPLDVFLTARWGLHSRLRGQTVWTPNEHEPWPLRSADLLAIDDELVRAAGHLIDATPTIPVRWSPGVHAVIGFPRQL